MELFKLSSSMLKDCEATEGSLLAACEFVERVVDVHGSSIEEAARLAKGTPADVGRLVEQLLLIIVDTSKHSLGSAWTRDKEQMPRQQSFESRPKAKVDVEEKPSSPEEIGRAHV